MNSDRGVWTSQDCALVLIDYGSTLQLTIQGRDAARYPAFGHRKLGQPSMAHDAHGGPVRLEPDRSSG
jgi:hypothetical protein